MLTEIKSKGWQAPLIEERTRFTEVTRRRDDLRRALHEISINKQLIDI